MNNNNLPELCDDSMITIFLGLPVESISRFKCLSKRWNRLLSSPSFGSKYLSSQKKEKTSFLPPVLGFFQSCSLPPKQNHPEYHRTTTLLLSFLTSPPLRLKFRSFVQRLGYFMGSSNGLILCGRHPTTYYVCNPISDRWVQLPQPNNNQHHNRDCGTTANVMVGFLYEEVDIGGNNMFGTFKVVRADLPDAYGTTTTLPIRTYSSRAGVWDDSVVLRCSVPFQLFPRWPAHVISGVIFWLAHHDNVAAYDPNHNSTTNSRGEHWLRLIKVPPLAVDGWDLSFILGESRDGLLQLGLNDYPGFRILTLRKKLCSYSFTTPVEVSEWIPTIRVIYTKWDRMPSPEIARWLFPYPHLLAFHPQSSRYVYIIIGSCIYQYDVETERKIIIPYGGGQLSLAPGVCMVPYFSPMWPWLPTLL